MQPWRPNWQTSLLPGLSITGLVIFARLLGILQPLEWKALDLSLRWRPAEAPDPRITIVEITDEDLQTVLPHPPSDQALADLIQTLQTYEPRVIGIDIFRDGPVGEGYPALVNTLEAADNVVAIHKILGNSPVEPLPFLSEDQVGFADAALDTDGFVRRSLLGINDQEGDYRFSFTIRLVEKYLAPEGVVLENGRHDPETMRFDSVEIPRFQSNSGGYIRTQSSGNQTLLNFRSGLSPFETITYQELISSGLSPDLIRNRVVLVGYTADSVKDFISSGAVQGMTPSLVPGVHLQAHAVSQILSAFYEGRPFLKTLPDAVEYLLIIGSGGLGIALVYWRRRPLLHLLIGLGVSGLGLVMGYGLLVASWWLPTMPMVIAFFLTAAVLYPFDQAQIQLRSQLTERQKLINQTFNTIHNGPLQTIASMLSHWPVDQSAPAAMRSDLNTLNQELRNIYDAMQQEMLSSTEQLVFAGQNAVDLQLPLNELCCEAYRITLERHADFFEPMIKIVAFEPMADEYLSMDQKRNIGRFLEEALINVQKYAKTTTRLTVDCRQKNGQNMIRVIDNGEGFKPATKLHGYGTRQAQTLARSLNGSFHRTEVTPKGICCELCWPTRQPAWKHWVSLITK